MRVVLTGGRVFDGTGAPIADSDVSIEDGRIVDVGSGLDGDESVDVAGATLLPGLFDCHVHIAYRYEDHDELGAMYRAVLVPVLPDRRRTCGRRSRSASPRFATPEERTPA